MAKATKGKTVTVDLTLDEKVTKNIVKEELAKALTAVKARFEAAIEAATTLNDPADGGEHCQTCGRAYHMVWWAHDGLWAEMTGHADGGAGLRCPACFDADARTKGIVIYWQARREEPE